MSDNYEPLSADILLSRGVCCGNCCSNCPYIPRHTTGSTQTMPNTNITRDRHLVGYSTTTNKMIEFIQTVAGQRILANMERFSRELPEKLDKIGAQMERIADGLERMQDINEGKLLPSEHGEPDAVPVTDEAEELAAAVIADQDLAVSVIADEPHTEEHIPAILGSEVEDESIDTPCETGSMNRQRPVPTEESEEEETV